MQLHDLTDQKVVLLGMGADVSAALPAIVGAGPASVVVVDANPSAVPAGLEAVTLEAASADADVFVRSPGFPRYQAPLTAALERGARMTTPLDLWMGTHGADRTVVAITGTKGKSTVTDLLGELVTRSGLSVGVAGNLGVPVFSDGWNHEAEIIVLEVSSYQAADLHHVPDMAIVSYLAEDHLSWHGSVERYVADKLRVVSNEAGTASRVLIPAVGGRAAEVLAEMGVVAEVIFPPAADKLVPVHRLQNAALAAAALTYLNGPELVDVEIVAAARRGLPGRLDACAGPDGVLCLDDALASNPSATAAALSWLRAMDRPTVVLLGGTDRGVDSSPLADEVACWDEGRLRAVVLPDNGRELADAVGITVVAEADDVADAVRHALAETRHPDAPEGQPAVLFSPAAATPKRIGNWETRAAQFREAVAADRG
ncbi:MAG: Mur ligase family protein [Aquihabitans sp.]